MKKVILISCVSKKRSVGEYPACQLYLGPLFKNSYEYAIHTDPDMIHILSAKYGLIDYNEKISYYNLTLNDMNNEEIKEWSKNVLIKLKEKYNLEETHFTILAGSNYYEYLIPELKNYDLPCGNLPIGKRVQWLQQQNRENRKTK